MLTTQSTALTTTGSYPVIEMPQGRRSDGWLDQLTSSLRSVPAALGLVQAQLRVELDQPAVRRGERVTGHVRIINRGSHRVTRAIARVTGGDTVLEREIEPEADGGAQELVMPFAIDVPEHVAPTWSLAYETEQNEGYQVQICASIGGATRVATAALEIS